MALELEHVLGDGRDDNDDDLETLETLETPEGLGSERSTGMVS